MYRYLLSALAIVFAPLTQGCFPHGYRLGDVSSLNESERAELNTVRVYTEEQLSAEDYEVVGPVEGASVKHLLIDPAPSADQALEQVRYWAWKKGANGLTNIRFNHTGLDYGTNTWSSVVCTALAIVVRKPEDNSSGRELRDPIAISLLSIKSFDAPATVSDVVKRAAPAVVSVKSSRKLGTGFIISKDGYILTANHIVGNDAALKIQLIDDTKIDAKVIRKDPGTDSALLKMEGDKEYPRLSVDVAAYPAIGEDIIAIGTPFSEKCRRRWSGARFNGCR
jgi:hypothetical protein